MKEMHFYNNAVTIKNSDLLAHFLVLFKLNLTSRLIFLIHLYIQRNKITKYSNFVLQPSNPDNLKLMIIIFFPPLIA